MEQPNNLHELAQIPARIEQRVSIAEKSAHANEAVEKVYSCPHRAVNQTKYQGLVFRQYILHGCFVKTLHLPDIQRRLMPVIHRYGVLRGVIRHGKSIANE